ncbi:MAG: hypothetical protein Hals2KO_21330 [Halioglobus sp.]
MKAVIADAEVALVPMEALEDTTLDDTDQRLLLALFSCCSFGTWRCQPTRQQLTKRTRGMSKEGIQRGLGVLRTLGWLHLEPTNGNGMAYVLHIPPRLGGDQ